MSFKGKQDDPPTLNTLCEKVLGTGIYSSDDFQKQKANKTQTHLMTQSEAEREVIVDYLLKTKSRESALLDVVKTGSFEPNVLMIVNILLGKGAIPSEKDEAGQVALHHATTKGFVDVVKELLIHEASPYDRDFANKLPLHIAIDQKKDNIAALLLSYMDNKIVRGLFTVPDTNDKEAEAELSLHTLIKIPEMEKTVLAVLNCMMDPMGVSSSVKVHYHALDADEKGRSPKHTCFNRESKSCLNLMSKARQTEFIYHDVVRLLLKRKWKKYARQSFLFNAAMIFFFETILCVGAVLASMTDPTGHTETLEITRAVAEYVFVLAVGYTLVLEINQIKKHRLDYLGDKFNILTLLSCVFLLLVIPLRVLGLSQQWPVYSVGFLLWTLRIFYFVSVFKTMGAYSQILWRIMRQDFPQFIGVFAIILIAFSGSFVLALRGEDSLGVHKETSNFWETMFTGVRILIEGQPVLEYFGPDGYSGLACFLMIAFLGMTCVVLLNILIAQLSDTYQTVQSDARRELELNRAWIITRVERHSLYNRLREPHRISNFKPSKTIHNPKEVLEKWDSPLCEINRHVKNMKDLHETHFLKLRHITNKIKHIEEQNSQILMLLEKLQPPVERVQQPAESHRDNKKASDPVLESVV